MMEAINTAMPNASGDPSIAITIQIKSADGMTPKRSRLIIKYSVFPTGH